MYLPQKGGFGLVKRKYFTLAMFVFSVCMLYPKDEQPSLQDKHFPSIKLLSSWHLYALQGHLLSIDSRKYFAALTCPHTGLLTVITMTK